MNLCKSENIGLTSLAKWSHGLLVLCQNTSTLRSMHYAIYGSVTRWHAWAFHNSQQAQRWFVQWHLEWHDIWNYIDQVWSWTEGGRRNNPETGNSLIKLGHTHANLSWHHHDLNATRDNGQPSAHTLHKEETTARIKGDDQDRKAQPGNWNVA